MSKPADLRNVMLEQSRGAPVEVPAKAEAATSESDPTLSPSARSRLGKSNVTGYYPTAVKKQLRMLAAERETTLQNLLGEAINDLFAKHGRPEIVPVDD